MIYVAFSESYEPKRFIRCWNKVEKNIFISNNQISSTVTTRTWVFVNRMDQNVAKYWYSNEKMVVVPVCLNGRCCYSGRMSIVSY